MTIAIAENVKRLRRERDMTQDELASVLGVTAQSVSKWEVGASYPDLETIPLIANFFDVSVDELLGMANIRDEERIAVEMRRMRALHNTLQGKTEAELEALGTSSEDITNQMREFERNLALEFPRNDEVQCMYAMRLINDGEAEKAVEIIERILARSTDTNYRAKVSSMSIRAYQRLGRHDKAAEIIAALPEMQYSRELAQMFSRNYTGGAKLEYIADLRDLAWQSFIQFVLPSLYDIQLVRKFLGIPSAEEDLIYLQLEEAMWRLTLLWGKDDLNGEPALTTNRGRLEMAARNRAEALFKLAQHYAAADADKALDYIEQAVELCCDPETPPLKQWKYFPEEQTNREVEVPLCEVFVRQFDLPVYNPIRGEQRFIKAAERMTAK